jgi:hypothetical protein
MLQSIIIGALSAFVGFAIGRIGDKYGGQIKSPHHWIYGLLLVIAGIFFLENIFGIILIAFGVGHFISDLDDFLHLRFYGVDLPHKWKFWDIK